MKSDCARGDAEERVGGGGEGGGGGPSKLRHSLARSRAARVARMLRYMEPINDVEFFFI